MNISLNWQYILTVIALSYLVFTLVPFSFNRGNKVFCTLVIAAIVAVFHYIFQLGDDGFNRGDFFQSYLLNYTVATSFYELILQWILKFLKEKGKTDGVS